MNWEEKTDQEILDQLKRAELARKLEESEEWQLVKEAMRRVHDKHVLQWRKTDPTDTVAMIQLQQICNLYAEDFLPALIRNFEAYGEFAYEQAKERGLLERIMGILK